MGKSKVSINYVLMCDDIRTEDNGKAIIIGLYNNAMSVPAGINAFVGPLVFVISCGLPSGESVDVKLWIEGPSGRLVEQNFGALTDPSEANGLPSQIVWRLFPWSSQGLGTFKLHLTEDDVDRVIYQFEIQERANS